MSQLLLPARSGIRNTIHCGDCLDVMYWLWRQGVQVDAIITDLPYGTTACSWDEIIPFAPMWKQVKRILKPRGVFVTTATEPFASLLTVSNLKWFHEEIVWNKKLSTGFLDANRKHMKQHENVIVFCDGMPTYNPQMRKGVLRTKGGVNKPAQQYGKFNDHVSYNDTYYPTTILTFGNTDRSNGLHPTQKPVELYEYLVRTYTQPGELVLDITAGSGTTGVACVKTGRDFILVDSSQEYCDIAHKRIHAGFVTVDVAEGVKQPSLFELAGATL